MKVFTGTVKSTNMQKTAVVEVIRIVAHPMYKKRMKKTKKFLVHDEIGVKKGQLVKFITCPPVSKLKKWKIIEIVGVNKEKPRTRARKARTEQGSRKEKML